MAFRANALALLLVCSSVGACVADSDSDDDTSRSVDEASQPLQLQPSSLIAYWPFNRSFVEARSGTAATAIPPPAMTSWVEDTPPGTGAAIDLDGQLGLRHSAAQLPALAGLRDFTLTFWVRPDRVDDLQILLRRLS